MEPYVQVHMDKITHTWDDLSGRLELDFRHYFGQLVDLGKPVAAPGTQLDLQRERGLPELADAFSEAVILKKEQVASKHPSFRPGGENPPPQADGSDPNRKRRTGVKATYQRI